MDKDEVTSWVVRSQPAYTYDCECGLHITGQSERGLFGLLNKHKKDGVIHLEWVEKGKI